MIEPVTDRLGAHSLQSRKEVARQGRRRLPHMQVQRLEVSWATVGEQMQCYNDNDPNS